ncbi:MAG TPA: tetratricopeptide repeat protein [Gemmatimonadales bacterium]
MAARRTSRGPGIRASVTSARVGSAVALAGAALAPLAAPLSAQRAPSSLAGDPLRTGRLASADSLWRAGAHERARDAYAAIVTGDTMSAPVAVLRLATLRAWNDEHDAAITLYRAYLRLAPDDPEARLALARTIAWAGRHAEAEAAYEQLLTSGLDERSLAEAEKGIARVAAWRSDLVRSERLWRAVTGRWPQDAEGWTGLAQVLHWAGQPREADGALDRALALRPDDADALEQRRWLRAELRPAAEPRVVSERDSDDNRSTVTSLTATFPSAAGSWTLSLGQRDAGQPGAEGTSRSIRAGGRWTLGRAVLARAELGATQVRVGRAADWGPDESGRTTPSAAASASIRLAPGASLAVGVSHGAFDETVALMRAGVRTTSVDVGGDVTLGGGLRLAVGASHTSLRGAPTANARLSGNAALSWNAAQGLSVTGALRAFGYTRSVREGYFAPDSYALGELGARWTLGDALGWSVSADAGIGVQSIVLPGTRETRGAQRAALGVAFGVRPGTTLSIDAALANVAGVATAASPDRGYRHSSIGLGARIGF